MGRIKSALIKRTAIKLADNAEFKDNFNKDFSTNKKILGNLMPSKRLRNMIAGYISRLRKRTDVKPSEANSENQKLLR